MAPLSANQRIESANAPHRLNLPKQDGWIYTTLTEAAPGAGTNDFIAMFKDSSFVSVITMVELTKVYGMLAMSTSDYIRLGVMTAGIYFALSYPASLYAAWLERKLHHDHR